MLNLRKGEHIVLPTHSMLRALQVHSTLRTFPTKIKVMNYQILKSGRCVRDSHIFKNNYV